MAVTGFKGWIFMVDKKNLLGIPYDMDFLLGIYKHIYICLKLETTNQKKITNQFNDEFRMSISCPPEVIPNHERQLFERWWFDRGVSVCVFSLVFLDLLGKKPLAQTYPQHDFRLVNVFHKALVVEPENHSKTYEVCMNLFSSKFYPSFLVVMNEPLIFRSSSLPPKKNYGRSRWTHFLGGNLW